MRRHLHILLLLALAMPCLAEQAPQVSWLWPHRKAGKPEKAYFRNEFTLPPGATAATLTVASDDWCRLFLNGEQIGMGSGWFTPRNYDLMPHLKPGANVIALEVRNGSGPAGLALRVRSVLKDGRHQDWVSDASWKCSQQAVEGWMSTAKPPATWQPPVLVAKMGDKPWGDVMPEGDHRAGFFQDVTADYQVAEGFRMERVFKVPGDYGSWVAMTLDDKGRFWCANQGGELYRVSLGEGPEPKVNVEPTGLPIRGAQGLLWHRGVLWVSVNEAKQGGVWKVTDSDGDGEVDKPELVKALSGRGEHGPHALVASPDGEAIYFVAGNHVNLPPMDSSVVPQVWGEDHLLPRRPDARGHARGRMAPGGWIARFKPDGTHWELFSIGYRNTYDAAFNHQGDLITYDSDMEWDLGMPWYRPTRFCHVVPGSEFGWRNGTGKWPAYHEDSMPGLIDIGPGSPTGVVSGLGASFPARYQQAIFGLDWTFATIYAIHLTPDGASYKARREEFVAGKRLPLTDAVIGDDGALYFLTGGRRTESAMWRVRYVGTESVDPVEYHHKPLELMRVDAAREALASPHRVERFQARVALEQQSPESLRAALMANHRSPWPAIEAAIGMARTGSAAEAQAAVAMLGTMDWGKLDKSQQLAWLRAVGLGFIRHGKPDAPAHKQLMAVMDPHFPSRDDELNRELCRMLSYLQAPGVVARTLSLMDSAGPSPTPDWLALAERNDGYGGTVKAMIANLPPSQVIHYAYCLRVVEGPWHGDERKRYFAWLDRLAANKGGASYKGFIDLIRKDALEHCTAEEKQLIETFDTVAPSNPFANLPPIKGPGRNWTVDEVAKLAAGGLEGRDHKRGEAMFRAGLCAACHRFGSEGGSVGPDLTNLGGRFSVRDIAVAIQNPNQTVSDQYAFDLIVRTDGTSLSGKVIEEKDEKWIIATNPFDLSQTIEIERGEISEIKPSPASPMPPGLINRMSEDELKDLLAYLLGKTGATRD